MIRRYSLRAPLAGAAQLVIVLSIAGARSAEPSTLDSEVKPVTPALARIETSHNRQPAGRLIGCASRPPRAGTFMHHSHFDELGQIASALYRSIVVLDRGHRYDGDTDRVLVLSDDGPTQNVIRGPFPHVLLNGEAQPKPMQLRSGVTYCFRLINIRTNYDATVSIFDDEEPAQWRVVAKDGADLPPSQATLRPATLTFDAGEIYDVEYTPTALGRLTLQFGAPKRGPIPGQATDVPVIVR